MRSMKKPQLALGLLLMALSLSGCAELDDYVINSVQIAADEQIQEREEYIQYEQYANDGVLDGNGTYALAVTDETNENTEGDATGLIPVTFAKNSFLSCVYYTNTQDQTVSSELCYLNPGDKVFAAGVTANNPNSNLYDFSEFRIWSYDLEGRRSASPYKTIKAKSGILFQIPQDYNGSGFSVEPVGDYADRQITVESYFIDNSGQKQELLGGRWEINGEPFKESTSISPVDSFTMVYDYSNYADDYYFVESTPSCWYSKESDHTVIFREASSNEETTDYSVCMHPYVTLTIEKTELLDKFSNKSRITSIQKNAEDIMPEDGNSIPNLKVGDIINIRVAKDCKLTGTGVNVGTAVPLGDGYEYTLIVPDTNKGITIAVSERNKDAEGRYEGYTIANADLTLKKEDGSVIKIGDELPGDSEKVTVEITPHAGYYIAGKNVKDDIYKKEMKYSKFAEDVRSIISDHPAEHFVAVTLDYNDECGECAYKLDGKDVAGSTVTARVGQTIELEFTADSRFKIVRDNWISDKWTSLVGSNSASAKIEVTADMDGITIDREAFGIRVE